MPKKLTKEEAQDWLDQNYPRYKILDWGGSGASKSKFLDGERDVEFWYGFSWVRSKLKKDPSFLFGSSEKEKREKIRQTNLKKYGNPCSLHGKETKEKVKRTLLKKYGVENISKSPLTKEKKEKTCIQNWGRKTNLQNEDQKEKIRQTNLEKYGFEYGFQNKKIKQKIRQSRIDSGNIIVEIKGKTIYEWSQEKKTASPSTLYRGHRAGLWPEEIPPKSTTIQLKVKKFLKEELQFEEKTKKDKIIKETDFYYGKKLPDHKGLRAGFFNPDFCFPKLKLIIEVDGEYWHTRTEEQVEHDKKRNKTYSDLGYDFLIFSGKDIDNNFELVKTTIVKTINKKKSNYERKKI